LYFDLLEDFYKITLGALIYVGTSTLLLCLTWKCTWLDML